MKKLSRALVGAMLLIAIAVNFSGCLTVKAKNLMDGITPSDVIVSRDTSEYNVGVTDFAVRIFKESCESGKNTLVSPISVLSALAMTANGSLGTTREEMEKVLGLSVENLNLYIYAYMNSLTSGQKSKLSLANSIWFTEDERFSVSRDFLQINADYYRADIYQASFNSRTERDINNWIKKETDGVIPKVIDNIPENAIMYLVNALAFEAEWAEIYEKSMVEGGKFTNEDGTGQDVEMMYSLERQYIEDDNAIGFIKYYSGYKYAMVALLPSENVSLDEYISSLDGERLSALLAERQSLAVKVGMPKFKVESDLQMSEILKEMGMNMPFDAQRADFSGLGTSTGGNVFISEVIHKTFIQVGEKGTRAGAATVVEMLDKSSDAPEDIEVKEVYLDRPFVYMIIDCKNNIPLFIGKITEINN